MKANAKPIEVLARISAPSNVLRRFEHENLQKAITDRRIGAQDEQPTPSSRGGKYRRPNPARTARIGKILLSSLYGGRWILGQSKNGMAHSHQDSIRK